MVACMHAMDCGQLTCTSTVLWLCPACHTMSLLYTVACGGGGGWLQHVGHGDWWSFQ